MLVGKMVRFVQFVYSELIRAVKAFFVEVRVFWVVVLHAVLWVREVVGTVLTTLSHF